MPPQVQRTVPASNHPPSGELDSLSWLRDLGERSRPLHPSAADHARVSAAHVRLLQALTRHPDRAIYGIHTFFGDNVRNPMDPRQWRATQADLLEYLQVGVGRPLPERVVRRALRLQALKVAHGLSGTHPATFQKLVELGDSVALPQVPREGSLGASGDLIPMAHAVAPVFAEGIRGPRDVLGLVNTNAMMASWAIEQLFRVAALLELAFDSTALCAIAVGAGDEHFGDGLGVGNVHGSYRAAGARILEARRRFLRSGKVVEGTKSRHQARYSIRCAPQVLGHCRDLLQAAEQRILSEATAVADNPLVLEDGRIWHGGLFYAIGIASAADAMTEVGHRLAELLDRQTLVLMDGALSGGLPDNLRVEGAGHCKGIHQLVSALLQKVKAQSTPSRALSFSCEGNNQDLVPCGMTALNVLDEMLGSAAEVVRGALFCSLRGATMRGGHPLNPGLRLAGWQGFRAERVDEVLA